MAQSHSFAINDIVLIIGGICPSTSQPTHSGDVQASLYPKSMKGINVDLSIYDLALAVRLSGAA